MKKKLNLGALLFMITVVSMYSCKKDPSDSSTEKLVTIEVGKHKVWEMQGDSAYFVVNIATPNSTGAGLKVFYEVSGCATMGEDYHPIPNFVTIAPGEQTSKIVIKPIEDDLLEETEIVRIKLTGVNNQKYTIGEEDSAHIIIMCKNGPVVTDIDGNVYYTVLIGSQTWMWQNLKTSKFRNGDIVHSWYYDNEPGYGYVYGRLYDWYAVNDSRGLCPQGWHVPTDAEWTQLTNYVGSNAGTKLKFTIGWSSGGNGTDEYGFSALPGGYRNPNGLFGYIGDYGWWWSATEYNNWIYNAWTRFMTYDYSSVYRDYYDKGDGISVRCLKD